MNPYLAGMGLGLVLLLAFVLMGRGLGASGAFSTIVAVIVDAVAPAHAQANEFYLGYLENGYGSPFKSFLMFEVIGVLVGGFISGALAGRIKRTVERGPRMSAKGRIGLAILGGTMMGFGAKLAGGCTSGQGLSGGAVLGLGSWTFMIMVFVGGYAGAYFLRREWR
ncbi:MAG: YeeE/YedE family protein [Deltaproteobacteria bacterium]|nr:YeeE/YedE family protein [Deltaproteobacteria bacterium]MBW2686463.1 YeeE/YedE family protein [Deltaproteobacteria bacterium]